MFVTKRRLDLSIHNLECEVRNLQSKYWELWHKHYVLLEHFKLNEVKIPEQNILRAKSSPEQTP